MARPLRIENLEVWKLACQFEDGVLRLLEGTPRARRDFKFYMQLSDAASSVANNVCEGYYRFNALEFANFLRYSRGSLREAQRRLRTGTLKGYWPMASVEPWLKLAYRLDSAIKAFRTYLLDRVAHQREQKRGHLPRQQR